MQCPAGRCEGIVRSCRLTLREEKSSADGEVDALRLNVLSWCAMHESVLKQLIEISQERKSPPFVVAHVLRLE